MPVHAAHGTASTSAQPNDRVEHIDTKSNPSDLLTKSLIRDVFEKHRAFLMNATSRFAKALPSVARGV